MNERMRRVMDRLQVGFLYDSPHKIAAESVRLSNIRFANNAGFVAENTRNFESFERTNDPTTINHSKFIATLFALSDPIDPNKYHLPEHIKQIDTTRIIELLKGNESMSLDSNKYSSLIYPIYLLSRALREEDSRWLKELMFVYQNRTQLRADTEGLRDKLLANINISSIRDQLRKKFDKSLQFVIQLQWGKKEEANKVAEKDIPHVPNIPERNLSLTRLEENRHPFIDLRLKQENVGIKDSKEFSDEQFFMREVLRRSELIIDKTGNYKINDKALQIFLTKASADLDMTPFIQKMKSKLKLSSLKRLTLASLITSFSENKNPDVAHWFFSEEKTAGSTNRLISSFDSALTEVFSLVEKGERFGLTDNIEKTGHFNFSLVNENLASILYLKYFKKSPERPELLEFLKLPGVSHSIIALRKLYLLKSLQGGLNQIEYDLTKFQQPFVIPSGADIGTTLDQLYEAYLFLTKGKLKPYDFLQLDSQNLLAQLSYFSMEIYMNNNKRELKNQKIRARDLGHDLEILLPGKLRNDKLNFVNTIGFNLPLQVAFTFDFSKLDIYLYDVHLGYMPIELEKFK